MPNHYFEIVKEQEDNAKILSSKSKDKIKIMNAFEEVGDSFVNAGYPENARENYSKALSFASLKKDKMKIEGKISKLITPISQKEKIVNELENMK